MNDNKKQMMDIQKVKSFSVASLSPLQRIKADFEKTAVSYQQQMINKIWAQAGMKALAETADIYPRMTMSATSYSDGKTKKEHGGG